MNHTWALVRLTTSSEACHLRGSDGGSLRYASRHDRRSAPCPNYHPKGAEEKARAFYCGLLGLDEISQPEILQGRGGFWLTVGDRQVHVGTEDGVERHRSKAHIAYEMRDLAAWWLRLQAVGVEILEGVPLPELNRIEFRDPFGNRVEMVARTT